MPVLVEIEADFADLQLRGRDASIRKLRGMWTNSRLICAATFLHDARQGNVSVLEGAYSEVCKWPIPLLQSFKNQACCVDAIPLAWIDTKVFETKLSHVLN
jgi:hypothetical protein